MKTTLIERMTKAKAPATWIREVAALEQKIIDAKDKANEYLILVDALATQLEREREELDEFERNRD